MHKLEKEIQRLAPRVTAAASELKALWDSMPRHPSVWQPRCRGWSSPPSTPLSSRLTPQVVLHLPSSCTSHLSVPYQKLSV